MMQSFLRPTSWIAKTAALLATLCLFSIPLSAPAQVVVGVTITTAPPALPYYEQPMLVSDGMIWQPGYWAWGPAGYYWVPGTWVLPPSENLYWTPGYWSFDGVSYVWNNGYWAPSVGYYGGIDYGYGYFGTGFVGGRWNAGVFAYNTAITNVNRTIVRTIYVDRTVIERRVVTRVSYNGPGGVTRRPTAAELAVARERHIEPTAAQIQHAHIASKDRNAYATINHERPITTAVERPIDRTTALPHYAPLTKADKATAVKATADKTPVTTSPRAEETKKPPHA
ncbi:MAG: YXWGXW repeat-containing protein [Candidatus Eremiobacteraeota bacterium]|nr:YXWGXW repeat-containing protein [Candidatus Eremiobacteraeota bacterium]